MKRSSLWVTLGAWLALFLALGAWGFSSPVGSAPDDQFHLASIWCGQGERDGLCEAGSTELSRELPEKALTAACYALDGTQTAACQGEDFNDTGLELVESDFYNSGTQYPSGFYYVMSFFASDNIAYSVLAMRFFNALLFSTLITATAVMLARRLRFALTGSVALTFIPLGAFTVASTNPSSWSLLANALLFPALVGAFTASGWRRWALSGMSVLALLLSISSRGDSAAFSIVAILAAAVVTFANVRRYWLTMGGALVLIAVAAQAFLSSGQTALAVNGEMGSGSDPTGASLALAFVNLFDVPSIWTGIFGQGWGLGWLDTEMPALASVVLIFLFSGTLFAALRTAHWRKILALCGVGFTLIVFPVYILTQSGSLVGANVQPRYLLPLITLFLAVALTPPLHRLCSDDPQRTQPLLSPFQLVMLTVGAAAANALCLYFNIKRYVSGASYTLNTETGWWWNAGPSPVLTLVLGSLAALVALIAMSRSAHLDWSPAASVAASSSSDNTGVPVTAASENDRGSQTP